MSVDLVGSTAFKANKKNAQLKENSPTPVWVEEFRTFYKDFPNRVINAYIRKLDGDGIHSHHLRDNFPRVWKTIGDEIIFCGRVRNVDHVALSVSAFLTALEEYSAKLEQGDGPLRLKGAGWLAAFPAPNISILVATDQNQTLPEISRTFSENTEEFEVAADINPHKFDFLGKGIDTGFRVAKNASEDRFVTSVQLGYVLACAATKKIFPDTFGYHGREILKGVIDGTPYPIISIDTERSEIKSQLRSREAALTGEHTFSAHALRDFLETFMKVSGIEHPCLSEDQKDYAGSFPDSFERYCVVFQQQLTIDNNNVSQVTEGNDLENPNDMSVREVRKFLDGYKMRNELIGTSEKQKKTTSANKKPPKISSKSLKVSRTKNRAPKKNK